MTQAAFLAEMDAQLHGAFADAGMGDAATYRSGPAADEVPCTVLVDQGAQLLQGVVVTDQVTIRATRAEIQEDPPRGAVFTVAASGQRWRVDSIAERDESAVVVVVSRA
jgi:hypothetical protein